MAAERAKVRKEAFEEAAKHLEEHALGFENSAKGMDARGENPAWRQRDEAIAYNLREKAQQIRAMK